jgi:hypothetical protein
MPFQLPGNALAEVLAAQQQPRPPMQAMSPQAMIPRMNQQLQGMGNGVLQEVLSLLHGFTQQSKLDPNNPVYGMMGPGSLGMVKAFHGSPHKFDKFSMGKVGTGEGAQAYGHGLYFTDKKQVAEHYRKALSPKNDMADNYIRDAGGDREKALWAFREYVSPRSPDGRRWVNISDEEVAAMEKAITEKPGATYKVNIDAEPDDLLDWDIPFSKQPPKVREALAKVGVKEEGATGEKIYRSLDKYQLDPQGQARVSKQLREAGIKGIRYLDGASRKKGKGGYNYVIFDDELVKIAGQE